MGYAYSCLFHLRPLCRHRLFRGGDAGFQPSRIAHVYGAGRGAGRGGVATAGTARAGNSRWRRLCDERVKAKSVFHFDVQGSVAKSTHSGLPWLRYLRRQLGSRVHFWPFDGWSVPAGRSVVAEIYPSLWRDRYARPDLTPDQHNAYVAATWLQEADRSGLLPPSRGGFWVWRKAEVRRLESSRGSGRCPSGSRTIFAPGAFSVAYSCCLTGAAGLRRVRETFC